MDPCASNPCQNGAACTKKDNEPDYWCFCHDNFRGRNCEFLIEDYEDVAGTPGRDNSDFENFGPIESAESSLIGDKESQSKLALYLSIAGAAVAVITGNVSVTVNCRLY